MKESISIKGRGTMSKLVQKLKQVLHVHKYSWTDETREWFFTGKKSGHIGSVCRCGKLSDKL
jgi:hypothetical protein